MATGILQSLGGGITPEEWERILAGQYPQGVMDFQGYDKMINQHYDEWSPTDGIPGEGNPHIGEPTSNLGLPDTASYEAGYSTGTGTNPNWGNKRYNYKKNIHDIQTIDMMFNSGEINPKSHVIVPRPDVGDGLYEVKLAQGSQFYNPSLDIFMPDSYQGGYSGATGDERYKQGTAGWGFSSYPHGSDRNYYQEKMLNERFMPLRLGA